MDQELKRQLDDLKRTVDSQAKSIEDLRAKNEELSRVLSTHTHSGNDGSDYLYSGGINLKPGQQFITGNFAFAESTESDPSDRTSQIQRGYLVVGSDTGSQDGVDNAQLTIENQSGTDSSTKQTFFYGFRGRVYSSDDGTVSSGGTTMTTSKFSFVVDELVGQYITVTNPNLTTEFQAYEIASNTTNSVTITGGTWSFSSSQNAPFTIFTPVYLGSGNYPWRRFYVRDGSAGGVRFGFGPTNGGQNGLLYMDGQDLKWRQPDGTVKTVTTA